MEREAIAASRQEASRFVVGLDLPRRGITGDRGREPPLAGRDGPDRLRAEARKRARALPVISA